MAKQETNFLEILFRETLIGVTMYADDGTPLLIEELNYDPIIKHIFIKSGTDSYKMFNGGLVFLVFLLLANRTHKDSTDFEVCVEH